MEWLEVYILNIQDSLGNPITLFFILFLMIVTQIFGALYSFVILLAAPKYSLELFLPIVVLSSVLAEIFCYLIGQHWRIALAKRFPKGLERMKRYTDSTTFVLGKLIGLPLLSYLMGVGKALSLKRFTLLTIVYFTVFNSLLFFLGQVLPVKWFPLLVIAFILWLGFKHLKKDKNSFL